MEGNDKREGEEEAAAVGVPQRITMYLEYVEPLLITLVSSDEQLADAPIGCDLIFPRLLFDIPCDC